VSIVDPEIEKFRWTWFAFSVICVPVTFLLPAPWFARAIGLAATWALAAWVRPLIRWSVADRKVPILHRDEGTVTPVHWDGGPRGPFVLGLAEATLFYASFMAHAPELAGAWLIFKTAAKWASWQHIMLMPQRLKKVDDIEYLEYRHAFSTKMTTLFVLGTLSNILVAAAGYVIMHAASIAS